MNESESVREFAQLLHRYPRQGSHRAARKQWDRLDPDKALVAEMHEALDWQAWELDSEGDFCPTFASWLRGMRWEDEPS